MSAMQRRKGHAYENEICTDIRDTIGYPAKRNLLQTREGGFDIEVGKYILECKRRKLIGVEMWLKQCEACTPDGNIPVVVMRADSGESMALLRWRDFMPLIGGELGEK